MPDKHRPGWTLGVDLLLASRALFDELHRRLSSAGHDLRPAHGFVLQIVSRGDAGASGIAAHLGVTKQAARLMLDELISAGYLERGQDAGDARRRPVRLTARGGDALARSAAIFDELRDELAETLGPGAVADGARLLAAIAERYGPAPLRPVW